MGDKSKILIVEDEVIVAKDIQISLENLGYEVCGHAVSGQDAISLCETKNPDIVLMDIVLNGPLDGIETSEIIRSLFNLPVIYLTAYSDEATIQKAKITEPFGYIIKPFEERDLKTTIEMALYKYKTDLLLNNKEKWLSTVFNSISEGIITTDMEGNIEFMNRSAEHITGYKIDDACKNHYSKILKATSEETGEEIFDFVSKCIKEGVEVIINDYVNLITKEGFETPVNITVNVLKDSSEHTIGTVINFVNMSALKNYENELTKYATTDSLTGVLNRKTGLFYLEKQIQLCKRYGNFFSIAYIDVNYLKEINEKFGENCGDEVLKIICSIIKNDIRESDTVCRLGGDEFLILFSMTSIEEARIVWERIEKKLDIYNSSKAKPFDISAACGLAQFEANDDKNLEELINIADEEMYRNKIAFKNKK